jgi:hypothetical protein
VTYRIPTAVATFTAGLALVACGSGSVAPAPVSKTPTPRPFSTPVPHPGPVGPFAVAATNSSRQGVSYQVEIIDSGGHIVASATAKLPLLKPNQTVEPPLVSASNDRVYYLDGDTDIRSLSPAGQASLVKSIAAGTSNIVTFAVSPDDQRIAVALMVQAADAAKSTGKGYVEDLGDPGNHVDLWSNTGTDALRWPAGWHGSDLVDDINDTGCGNGYGYGPSVACSYHVVNASNGNRLATVCESPPSSPSQSSSSYYTVDGSPTGAGVACLENLSVNGGCNGGSQTWTITQVDWTGKEHDFISKTQAGCTGNGLTLNNCYLSTSGSLMACLDSVSNAVTMLKPDGTVHSLGRKYNILGWVDATHLFVDVDASSLGIVATDTGALTSISIAHADQVGMVTGLPGAL